MADSLEDFRRAVEALRHPHPCPNCGATEYTWGRVRCFGRNPARFVADGDPLLVRIGIWGGVVPRVRRCRVCGNLQFFA